MIQFTIEDIDRVDELAGEHIEDHIKNDTPCGTDCWKQVTLDHLNQVLRAKRRRWWRRGK